MRRVFGWILAMAAAMIGTLALSGWVEQADKPIAASAPLAEIEALESLAEGVIAGENRLWVITVRDDSGMLRWSGGDPAMAETWMDSAKAELHGDPIWYVNVQGELDPAQDEIGAVREQVRQRADGRIAEKYEEATTFSYSYTSPRWQRTVRSGDADIALQAAGHLDTETNRWRITIGTPAILIEY